ncbi:transcriptional regulator with XRE-family HTH domain [Phytomonospora endophytica]|uniref:Transcriptional regulator with XRE-family HTH domain n=1 Tax=Phytomonospora endophytica TaxID=714109 RepID=A0A841FQE1_9ACTN|nr:transcriptional regulator with XRE-family HTH domain [Phytomonospora endophytica]
MREENGHTLEYAAQYLECSTATVSRIELAQYPIKSLALKGLLDLYNVSDRKTRDFLLELREEAWRKGWWDGYGDAYDDPGFIDYPWLESRATNIRSYETMLVPGLLQTPAYAEAVIRAFDYRGSSDAQISRWVELRIERHRILTGVDATALTVIVDESALRRPIGGDAVMRAQLHRLLETSSSPNVTVLVLPFTAADQPCFVGPFTIFELPDPYPDVAHVESLAGRAFVEKSDQIDRFEHVYADLHQAALSPELSADFIANILEETPK